MQTETRPSRWEGDANPTFKTDLPCPQCGEKMVLGHYFLTPDTHQHQHTHYVCLSWPSNGIYETKRCGWHGWVVPPLPNKKCPKARKETGKKAKPRVPHEAHTWRAGVYYPIGEVDGWIAQCPGYKEDA